MKVLVACEFSGVVRDAFLKRGHDAISCDILPSESPGPHYQGDVLDLMSESWDLVIAHPPCTYLSQSGVRWLHTQEGRWEKMKEGAEFFSKMFEFDSPRIAVENPVQHGYAIDAHGRGKYTQKVQPWQFGHPEKKGIALWLKGLPPLVDSDNVKEEMLLLPKNQQAKIHMASESPDRWKLRSLTYPGLGEAMAEQWGNT